MIDLTPIRKAHLDGRPFVTMTVPVEVAMLVADATQGEKHSEAKANVLEMLVQDLAEEYGITVKLAHAYSKLKKKGGDS